MGSLLSEEVALVATIDPDAYAAGTHGSDWVDMTEFQQVMCTLYVGVMGTTAGVTVQLEQATDSSGTSAKNITGKATTELTKVATEDDKQAIINVKSDELDVANDFTHVRAVMTVATATSDAGLAIYGRRSRHKPASDNDLASVAEIVS